MLAIAASSRPRVIAANVLSEATVRLDAAPGKADAVARRRCVCFDVRAGVAIAKHDRRQGTAPRHHPSCIQARRAERLASHAQPGLDSGAAPAWPRPRGRRRTAYPAHRGARGASARIRAGKEPARATGRPVERAPFDDWGLSRRNGSGCVVPRSQIARNRLARMARSARPRRAASRRRLRSLRDETVPRPRAPRDRRQTRCPRACSGSSPRHVAGAVPIEQIELLVSEAGDEHCHLALARELQARASRDRKLLEPAGHWSAPPVPWSPSNSSSGY